MTFVWMAETPVPIKEEDPGTPPPPKPKKGSKRARAPDSPESPRVMTRRKAAQQGEAAMVEEGEGVMVIKEGKPGKPGKAVVMGEEAEEIIVKKEEEEEVEEEEEEEEEEEDEEAAFDFPDDIRWIRVQKRGGDHPGGQRCGRIEELMLVAR